MKRTTVWVLIALIVGGLVGSFIGMSTAPSKQVATSMKAVMLKQSLRKLWADHVIWTRQYIVAAVAGTADAKPAAERLLKNQEDLGNAIVPVYGADAGKKLTGLLKEHIMIAVDLVEAAKANESAKMKDADKRWHDNAVEIADFLSSANPNWPKAALVEMLNEHLAATAREAVDRLKKDYKDDVANFDNIFNQATMMADEFADGIVKQFPDKF